MDPVFQFEVSSGHGHRMEHAMLVLGVYWLCMGCEFCFSGVLYLLVAREGLR